MNMKELQKKRKLTDYFRRKIIKFGRCSLEKPITSSPKSHRNSFQELGHFVLGNDYMMSNRSEIIEYDMTSSMFTCNSIRIFENVYIKEIRLFIPRFLSKGKRL